MGPGGPGPGAYRIKGDAGGPKYVMGLKNEFEKKNRRKDDPGPGQYDPRKSSHKISYSICGRGDEGKGQA